MAHVAIKLDLEMKIAVDGKDALNSGVTAPTRRLLSPPLGMLIRTVYMSRGSLALVLIVVVSQGVSRLESGGIGREKASAAKYA